MMAGFPHKKSVRARLRHVWDTYVNWGVKNPQKRKVLAQLTFSGMLSKETIKVAPFVEMQNTIRNAVDQHILRPSDGSEFKDVDGLGRSHHGSDGVKAS